MEKNKKSTVLREQVYDKYTLVQNANLPPRVLCRVTYPICNINQLNANKRKYGPEVWETVMASPDLQEKLKNRCLYGHAEHPNESQNRLERTSHVINKMWTDGKTGRILQEMDVLDTPYGRIVDTLLEAGCGVGVSTRAEGELEESVDEQGQKFYRVIPESYNYITTDFTADPSTTNPYPEQVQRRVVESIEKDRENMDSEFAIAMLENLTVDTAKSLCESIRAENKSRLDEKIIPIVAVKLNESRGKTDEKFVKKVLSFIDEQWKEQREKDLVKVMSEYREQIKVAPKNAVVDYLKRLWKTNEKSVTPFVSKEFSAGYQSLLEQEDEGEYDMDGEMAAEEPVGTEPAMEEEPELEAEPTGEEVMGPGSAGELEDELATDLGDVMPNIADLEGPLGAQGRALDGATSAFLIPIPIIDPRKADIHQIADRFGYLDWMTDGGNVTGSPYYQRLEKERLDLLDELSYRWNRAMQESKNGNVEFLANSTDEKDPVFENKLRQFIAKKWSATLEKKIVDTISRNNHRIFCSSTEVVKDYLKRLYEANEYDIIADTSEDFARELLELVASQDLDETEEIKKIYRKAGVTPPKGKGVHTAKFHKMAAGILKSMKPKSESVDITEWTPSEEQKRIAYATAMKRLGKQKAVKKGHRRRKNENIQQAVYENYFGLVDFLSGKKPLDKPVGNKKREKKALDHRDERDIVAGRLEEKKVNEQDERKYTFTVNNLQVEVEDTHGSYEYPEDIEAIVGTYLEYGDSVVKTKFPGVFVSGIATDADIDLVPENEMEERKITESELGEIADKVESKEQAIHTMKELVGKGNRGIADKLGDIFVSRGLLSDAERGEAMSTKRTSEGLEEETEEFKEGDSVIYFLPGKDRLRVRGTIVGKEGENTYKVKSSSRGIENVKTNDLRHRNESQESTNCRIDNQISEASIRAERDKAFEIVEQLTEQLKQLGSSKDVEVKLLLSKLKDSTGSISDKYTTLKKQLKETFGKLKIAHARIENLSSELDKVKKAAKGGEEKMVELEHDYGTKIEQLESKIIEERQNLFDRLVRSSLAEAYKLVPQRTLALLRECETVEELEKQLVSVRAVLRENALRSSNRIEGDVVVESTQSVDPRTAEVKRTVGLACEGILVKK